MVRAWGACAVQFSSYVVVGALGVVVWWNKRRVMWVSDGWDRGVAKWWCEVVLVNDCVVEWVVYVSVVQFCVCL